MFEEFELAAIISKDPLENLRYVPLSQDLKSIMNEVWKLQYDSFLTGEEELISFDPAYKPDEDEVFYLSLSEGDLPYNLERENSTTISDLEPIPDDETEMDLIKGIAAFVRNQTGEEIILFQRFMRAQVIRRGFSAIWGLDTFLKIDHPGFMFGEKLSAVYLRSQGKLLFRSFYNVDRFLPLSEYFRPASEDEIREILSHELFDPEDLEASATNPSPSFSKKFALLRLSGVLDNFTAPQIETQAQSAGVPIQLSDGNNRIVFPSKKSDALELLQFLNDDLVNGALTGTSYITNSKRKRDQ